MKRTAIAISLVVLAAAARAQEPPEAGDPGLAVRDVLLQNARAFENADMKKLDEIWAHGAEVTVFENGHANYGWTDYRDHHLKPEVEEMKNVEYQITDVQTHVAAATAWSTFKYSISAEHEGRKVEGAGLGTAVLEKRGDGWKIHARRHNHRSERPVLKRKAVLILTPILPLCRNPAAHAISPFDVVQISKGGYSDRAIIDLSERGIPASTRRLMWVCVLST